MLQREALDELRGSILRDVSPKKLGPQDQFWSDAALLRYLDEAQRWWARTTFCLRESRDPEIAQFVIRSGQDAYVMHPSLVFIASMRVAGDSKDLVRVSHGLDYAASETYVDPFNTAVVDRPDHPVAFSTDEGIALDEDHAIVTTLYPTPDASVEGVAVNIRGSRLPLLEVCQKNLGEQLEVPREHQLDMLERAAWRALRNWDVDSEDRTKAETHKTQAEAAAREARREVLRKIHQPVKWRFGENAYSYIRR